MLHLSLVISLLVLGFICLVSSRGNDNRNIRCADVEKRVQCGFPGISKRKCLEDSNCCFDSEADEEDVQCFFRVPPKRDGCCDVKPKKRCACRVKGIGRGEEADLELDENPYLCRRLGCCFDGKDRGISIPRCYKTKPDCCKKIKAELRVDAALTHVNRQQCLRMPGTCFSHDKKPNCYYKYSSRKCQKRSHRHRRPCSRNHEINNNPYRCLKAGCCFDYKNKCYKPEQHRRSIDLDSMEGSDELSEEYYNAEAAAASSAEDEEEDLGYEEQSSDVQEDEDEGTPESQTVPDEEPSIRAVNSETDTETENQLTRTQIEREHSMLLAENASETNITQPDTSTART